MLTIQNTHKIQQKTLGKKNFYVVRVEEVLTYNADTFESSGRYVFELTNRQYAITVTLDREEQAREGNFDYCLKSSTGHMLYLHKKEIQNIDTFIDRLRKVALG